MYKTILNILLILSLSTLIYLGNILFIEISLFLLIILMTLNKNYFSYLSIIPLIFVNQYSFFIFAFICLFIFLVNKYIKNKIIRNISIFTLSLIFFFYAIYILNIDIVIISLLYTIIVASIIVNSFVKKISNQYLNESLILFVSIISIMHVDKILFLSMFLIIICCEALLYKKYYYIITSFLICSYALLKTQNGLYILIQFMAYLGCFINYVTNSKKHTSKIEFVLEDININVSNFCNFINYFSQISYKTEYEKHLSSAIKILIENHCTTCKKRNLCYGDKKLKTYIFLKDILTKKSQINSKDEPSLNFECLYYSLMTEQAISLKKQYNLYPDDNLDEYKLLGVCSSVQNYFISLFDKMSPKYLKVLNFKKELLDRNINYILLDYSMTNEYDFEYKIKVRNNHSINIISDFAKEYFDKNIVIDVKDKELCIHPFKNFKVIYDSATLSFNNCQISGDNFMFKVINNTNFICALSDGMGSGYEAYELSQKTLKMVDQITNCNIDFQTSLEILNNFFKAKDMADSYATLDFVNINLINGVLNLYKLGSSTTYISRNGTIIPIYNNNLPFGISELITKEDYTVCDGDLIILVSDGINDYIDENRLLEFIKTIQKESPHKIVYEILQKIYYENNSEIKDDMSCIAIKVIKNTI